MQFNFRKFLLAFFSFAAILFAMIDINAQTSASEAILQGAIIAQPTSQPSQFQTDKIQPGQSVKLSVLVENVGEIPSPPGKISIRFALAKPLDEEAGSLLFETEQLELPSIPPATSLEIAFEKTHKWPALPDFIRDDWGMREYQAIYEFNQHKDVIGSLAITFSAYYYPGIRKELPLKIAH